MSDPAIIGVIEFGSTARRDSDEYSDKDIFAVVEDVDADIIDRLRRIVALDYATNPASVACYSASSFDQMIAHGSLFTWHLRLEGRTLNDPDGVFTEAFANLAQYDSFADDIERFNEIYTDASAAYGESGILDTFERHVLFVVARNVCMLLTARRGRPTFGRRTVIPTARELYPGLPLSRPVEEALMAGHLTYMRNIRWRPGEADWVDPERTVGEVGMLLAFAAEVLQ